MKQTRSREAFSLKIKTDMHTKIHITYREDSNFSLSKNLYILIALVWVTGNLAGFFKWKLKLILIYLSYRTKILKHHIININKHRKHLAMPTLANPPKEQVPYSLLAELYRSWEEYQIPAVFYHYTLSILPNLERKKQMLLMSK